MGQREVARAADALVEVEKLIKTLITLAAVIGVDETSMSIAGKSQWLHVARTDTLTAYHLHESRGRVAVNQFGIMPAYTGTAVHDALSVTTATPPDTPYSMPIWSESSPRPSRPVPTCTGAVQARTALVELDHHAHIAGTGA